MSSRINNENKISDFKTRLNEYLSLKTGFSPPKDRAQIQCPNPSHSDKNPSATYYFNDGTPCIKCHACGDKSWDIFDVAGLYHAVSDFKEQLKLVEKDLAVSSPLPTKQQSNNRSPQKKVTLVSVPYEKARDIFSTRNFSPQMKQSQKKWGEFKRAWAYKNKEGSVDIVDFRFEKEDAKTKKVEKTVISFFYNGKNIQSTGCPSRLYNLDLIKKHKDLPIVIHEGAKATEIAKIIPGFIHTTWNGGGNRAKNADWTALTNRTVYIYPDWDLKKNAQTGKLIEWKKQAGILTAFTIQKILKEKHQTESKIVIPIKECKEIASSDIVEALGIKSAEELANYIKEGSEVINPLEERKKGNEEEIKEKDGFLKVLGIGDDKNAYFIDRTGRIANLPIRLLNQGFLLSLACEAYWMARYSVKEQQEKVNWVAAIDGVIEQSKEIDFDPDNLRGRGAWREPDGRICYHNGKNTIGDFDPKRIFVKSIKKDIGIEQDKTISVETRQAILDNLFKLSIEKDSDGIRLISWAILSPFAGALPWRPSGLITGPSESGKSVITDLVIRPIALPIFPSGGGSTEPGIRQIIESNACSVLVEEIEGEGEKNKINKEAIFGIMRQSTSDDTPKIYKGSPNGIAMHFVLKSMFLFAAVNPIVENIADQNRLFFVNIIANQNKDWRAGKKKLKKLLTKDNCVALRALTWKKLSKIITLCETISMMVEEITGKSPRFGLLDGMLLSAYILIWKGIDNPTEEQSYEIVKDFYQGQKLEKKRDETEEMITRLLDQPVSLPELKTTLTLRQMLICIREGKIIDLDEEMEQEGNSQDDKSLGYQSTAYSGAFEMTELQKIKAMKSAANRFGVGINPIHKELAIDNNNHEIRKILHVGKGYNKLLWRHPKLLEKSYNMKMAGKSCRCTVIEGALD